jgi:hypothetical protein
MVLHLAVENNWGGGDSYRKATLLLEEVLKLYQPNPRAGLRPRRAPDQYVGVGVCMSVWVWVCACGWVGSCVGEWVCAWV